MNNKYTTYLMLMLSVLGIVGCSGVDTFGTVARSGDTVTMAFGWKQGLSRANINSITITDSAGTPTVYGPNDPAIRSVFNSYPDPLSKLVVDAETGSPSIMSILIEGNITNGDKDYSESLIMLNLPAGMQTGVASIVVDTIDGPLNPVEVLIVSGDGTSGQPANFLNYESLAVNALHLKAMERAPHYTVTFECNTVPHAIQVDLMHALANDGNGNGGTGYPYAVNPRGDIKSMNWSDDGTNMRVILMPTHGNSINDMVQFKFYVAGGLQALALNDTVQAAVRAFDVNGAPIVDPITVHIN